MAELTVTFHLNVEVDLEDFLDQYPQQVRQDDACLVVSVPCDEVLLESLAADELAEFYGLDSEFLVHFSIEE
jgi:hypothetical protein